MSKEGNGPTLIQREFDPSLIQGYNGPTCIQKECQLPAFYGGEGKPTLIQKVGQLTVVYRGIAVPASYREKASPAICRVDAIYYAKKRCVEAFPQQTTKEFKASKAKPKCST